MKNFFIKIVKNMKTKRSKNFLAMDTFEIFGKTSSDYSLRGEAFAFSLNSI